MGLYDDGRARFSEDADWMPRLVLMAKQTYVVINYPASTNGIFIAWTRSLMKSSISWQAAVSLGCG